MCKVYRAQEASGRLVWNMHCTQDVSEGRTFADLVPMMQRSMQQVFPTVVVTPDLLVPIVRKGEHVTINPGLPLVTVGLGFEPFCMTLFLLCKSHETFSQMGFHGGT